MKQNLLVVAAVLLSLSTGIRAQGTLEGNKMSQTDLRGTARSMSMGGAMGALGGDITAISINPAGIGVYKSSEIVTTLNLESTDIKSTSNFQSIKEGKTKFNFNNLAFVGTFPIYNDVAPLVNFGFSYNRVKSFEKKYSMRGAGANNGTLSEYMAYRANKGGYTAGDLGMGDLNGAQAAGKWMNEDWLPLLGYNSFLMKDNGKEMVATTKGLNVDNGLFVEEKGSVNKYDFNVGTTFADMISAGITVSVTDIDYRMYSENLEDFYDKNTKGTGGYTLINGLKTEGTGWELGLGVIFKPIDELRFGISYHSPTWYKMSDYYYADLDHNFSNMVAAGSDNFGKDYKQGKFGSMDGKEDVRTDYRLRTPDKWTFSAAAVLGGKGIISLDYELVDYTKTHLENPDGRAIVGENNATKDYFKLTSTLRVGAEYRITPQFSGRVGYQWQQNPYSDYFLNNIDPEKNDTYFYDTVGSVPHYVIGKDTHYITWGLGYKFTKNFYTDIAFVYKTQKGDLYTHSMSDRTSLKEDSFQGSLTFGVRF